MKGQDFQPGRSCILGRMSRKVNSRRAPAGSSIRSRAYVHIQQLVASGALPAGSGISELHLAKELGSSRTPIREAMNQLAAEGLLKISTGGGMVVNELTREDIVELYELREALEVYAVGKMARASMHPADQARLQQLVDGIGALQQELQSTKKDRLNAKQMERFLGYDLGFHALLISMAHNSRLEKIINDTRLLISIFAMYREGHDLNSLKEIQRFHQKILDAVAKQDPETAVSLLAQHIQASRTERLNDYDHWSRESTLKRSVPSFFDVHK